MSDAVEDGRQHDETSDAAAVPRPPDEEEIAAEVGMAGPENGAE